MVLSLFTKRRSEREQEEEIKQILDIEIREILGASFHSLGKKGEVDIPCQGSLGKFFLLP